MAKYFIAGTNETTDDPNEYLKKEEKYCKENLDYLRVFWNENKDGEFDDKEALKVYMEGLREDVKNDPQYTVN